MSPSVVEGTGLTKTYGRAPHAVHAVVSADLAIRPREIVGILGRSGSGKSTLLRMLCGMEAPSAGTVLLGGVDATRQARTGYVMPIFQNPTASLDPRWPIWRTITEPLTAPHRKDRPNAVERKAMARERLASVGLSSVDLEARPGELSGGQCQRVSIIRALVARPALLAADEPTSALDPSIAAGILHLLRAAADAGTAIVVVSHDRNALAVLCDRVFRMDAGRLSDTGSVLQ